MAIKRKPPNYPWMNTDKKGKVSKELGDSNSWSEVSKTGFYKRKAWLDTRNAFRARYPLCAHCLAESKTEAMAIVDHKVPLTLENIDSGLAYDWDNLQSLCFRHHVLKTNSDYAKARGIQMKHVDLTYMAELEEGIDD